MIKGTVLMTLIGLSLCANLRYEHEAKSESSPLLRFLIGPLLVIIAFPIIWYNERKASIDAKHLAHAKEIVQSYSPNESLPPNQLIHLSGKSVAEGTLRDPITGASASNVLKISTYVEVREWRKTGGEDSTVVLEWVSENKQTVQTDHKNDPSNWIIKNETVYASNAHLGRYRLSKTQMAQCNRSINIHLSEAHVECLKRHNPIFTQRVPHIQNDYLYFSRSGDIEAHGSLRMKVGYCPTGPISVMCEAAGMNLIPYKLMNEVYEAPCILSEIVNVFLSPMDSIDLVREEQMTKEQLLAAAVEDNTVRTNTVRLIAFGLIVLGIVIFLSPLAILLGKIPLVGGFLKMGSVFVFLLAATIITIPVFIIFLSIAWLYYNPRVGIIILSIGIIILTILLVYNSMAARTPPPTAVMMVPMRPRLYY